MRRRAEARPSEGPRSQGGGREGWPEKALEGVRGPDGTGLLLAKMRLAGEGLSGRAALIPTSGSGELGPFPHAVPRSQRSRLLPLTRLLASSTGRDRWAE